MTGSSVGLVVGDALEVDGLADDGDAVLVDGDAVLVEGEALDRDGVTLQEMGNDRVGKHVIVNCASASPCVSPTPTTCQIANNHNPRTATSARRGISLDVEPSSIPIEGPYPPLKP